MAEYKQYISQEMDNGSVMISEDVAAAIVEHTLSEVEGIAGIAVKSGSDIADLIGKKNWGKGMKVLISEDNSLSVDCNVNVCYGQSVVDVAEAAQSAIANAIESMTGVKVTAVNINVCGIIRK